MKTENLEMTPEIKAKLNNLIGFNVDAILNYVPGKFKELPKKYWCLFKLKTKSGLDDIKRVFKNEIYEINDGKINKIKIDIPELIIESLEDSIIEVKNYPLRNNSILNYKDGKLLISKNGKQTEKDIIGKDLLKYFPSHLLQELSNAIENETSLTDEELRGLESSPI